QSAFGYSASAWGGDCAADGSVSLSVGENKTCTITNDDVPSEIHGQKFNDLNGNGIKDQGEPGLPNWTINLSGAATASTTTDANGGYAFLGLNVGTYVVTETQQAGWTQTTSNPAPIALGLGQIADDVDFGNFQLISLSGHKWHDLDGDGLQGSGEGDLSGWTFYVDLNGNQTMDAGEPSAVSGTNGAFTITGVGPGAWSVCEAPQAGWQQTFPLAGACYSGTASSGVNGSGLEFGNVNEHEGTIGLWRNWFRHNKYTQAQIDGWLSTINSTSGWLMTEAGYSANTTGMVNLINDATKFCSKLPDKIECANRKFLAQYMVNRLNVLSGRKTLSSTYDLSSFGAAMNYLGISPTTSVMMSTYITKVEAKVATSPSRNQYLWMASVSDFINNIGL
ncbi:MAG TPA: SdrD B-like domain-containing protein, partial [Candidatus Eisenbacteria bacterium]|nr:SdrD B-like domain-containing protein [Candidatus Eisenbacteria bacterium]